MSAQLQPHAAGAASARLAEFDWADPFRLHQALSDEERLIAESVREYCSEQLMPRILEANRHETFDPGIFKELGELGFLGVTLPEEYVVGGTGYLQNPDDVKHGYPSNGKG